MKHADRYFLDSLTGVRFPTGKTLTTAPSTALAPADSGDTKQLANWWADLLNGYAAAGEEVPEEILDAAATDLGDGEWVVARDGDAWAVHHASDAEGPDDVMEAERAPKGGISEMLAALQSDNGRLEVAQLLESLGVRGEEAEHAIKDAETTLLNYNGGQ